MTFLLLALVLNVCQDKPPIDTGSLGHWPSLGATPEISACGNYIWYTVEQKPANGRTGVLRQTHGSWKREFTGAGRCYFPGNERQAVVQRGDSLHFISLGGGGQRSMRVTSVQWPIAGEGRWLAYQRGKPEQVMLVDFQSGEERGLGRAGSYGFDKSGTGLLVISKGDDTLFYIGLPAGEQRRIWTGNGRERVLDWRFADDGGRLAFIIEDSGYRALWLYRKGEQRARIKLADNDSRIGAGLRLGGRAVFSKNGRWIFFSLGEQGRPVKAAAPASPEIWGWKDRRLQPERAAKGVEEPRDFAAAAAADDTSLLRLEYPGQRIITPPELVTGDLVVVGYPDGSYRGLCLTDGSRRRITAGPGYPADLSFSPDGKWLVYYDTGKGQYCSYAAAAGVRRILTLPRGTSNEYRRGVDAEAVAEPAGWIADGSAVLLYDNYDCWAVDPANHRRPVCITDGYGFAHHIKLRLIGGNTTFPQGDTLLLTGFDTDNKYNGYFRQILGRKSGPECLTIGPYTYYRVESQKPHRYAFDNGMLPRKAANANVWVIKRESAREPPNYFLTTDFRHFDRLTGLAPQAGFNWLTTELVKYRQLDGVSGQGILYKPENFNPAKRYPVIFSIYEQLSHRLYEFPQPEAARDNIDIPWLVSRGYLVFTPDISYRPASVSNKTIGQWAYTSVGGAVRRLAEFSWVDSKRIGIQGHSLGAEEASYLITHTHLFAAAAEMAGVTDPVSAYLGLLPAGDHPLEMLEDRYIWEKGQARMGATLWQRPDLYLRESTVLHADRITTPLLLVHNQPDAAVPWRQAVELYLALRRLGKPVWLLQYEDENHSFLSDKSAIDYTLRLTDFFDHYLKDKPLPMWMYPRD